jgi:hypothetical protein
VRSCFGSCSLATAHAIGEACRWPCMADGCPIDLMDGPAPGEREERRWTRRDQRKGKEPEKEQAHSLSLTTVIIVIYYHHLLLHNLLLSPLNCCSALCHTQHNSAYPLLSRARADTHIQLFPSRLLNTHTRTLASPPSLAPPLHPTDRKPLSSSQPLPSRLSPLWSQQPYHLWSPMRSAQ